MNQIQIIPLAFMNYTYLFLHIVLTITICATPLYSKEEPVSHIHLSENSIPLRGDNWKYTYTDTRDTIQNMEEYTTELTWRDYNSKRPADNPSPYPYLIIRIPLPNYSFQCPVIVVPALSYYGAFEAYIDGNRIYKTILQDKWAEKYLTRQVHLIPLPCQTKSDSIDFLLHSKESHPVELSPPLRLASSSSVKRQLVHHTLEFSAIGLVFILIALISFIAAVHIPSERRKPLSYSILSVTAGLYLLVNADLTREIFELPHLISWYVSMVAFYSFPVGMFSFLEYNLDRPLKQVNRVQWKLHLIFAMFAISLEALGILGYMSLLPYFLMLLGVNIIVDFVLSLPVFFNERRESGSTSLFNKKIITLGEIIFFFSIIHDILATFRVIHTGRSFFHIGLLIFTLFLAYILIKNYIDAEIKLRKNSQELKEKSNQLEEYSHNLEEKVRDRTLELQENIVLLEKEIALREDIEKRLIEHESKLEDLNATKDRFFSIIAHDLRNPFNSIIGMSGLINQQSEKLEKEKIIEFVQDIHSSSLIVYKLLENFLEWSRLQRGIIKPEPEALSLNDYLQESLSIHQNLIHDKAITVTREIRKDMTVYGDGNMFRTILRNLISNAIKFTPRKGTIALRAERNGDMVNLSVADTGVGIPEDVVPRLFDIDRQHSTKGTEREAGSGLGLILCKEFIEKMKGSITVTSESGKGSVFTILLPALPEKEVIT